jgi:hypothetical protein
MAIVPDFIVPFAILTVERNGVPGEDIVLKLDPAQVLPSFVLG